MSLSNPLRPSPIFLYSGGGKAFLNITIPQKGYDDDDDDDDDAAPIVAPKLQIPPGGPKMACMASSAPWECPRRLRKLLRRLRPHSRRPTARTGRGKGGVLGRYRIGSLRSQEFDSSVRTWFQVCNTFLRFFETPWQVPLFGIPWIWQRPPFRHRPQAKSSSQPLTWPVLPQVRAMAEDGGVATERWPQVTKVTQVRSEC